MSVLSRAAEIWRLIDFQDGGRCGAILLPHSDWVIHFLQVVNVYQHTKYRQASSIHGQDETISVLEKQASVILKFFLRFWLWPHHRNPHDITHEVAKLHIGPPNAEIWRHIDFWRWRLRLLNSSSGFQFVEVTAFRRSMFIKEPNFVDVSECIAEI